MQPRLLRKPLAFSKEDITATALVALYIGVMFLMVLAWNYLSDKADAFVSDAKEIGRQELVDTVRFQAPPLAGVRSREEIYGADRGDSGDFIFDFSSPTPRHF